MGNSRAEHRETSAAEPPDIHDHTLATSESSIEDAIAQESGEWIVMRVTGYDEDHRPAAGQIVARASPYAEALHLLNRCLSRSDPARDRYHLFRAQRTLLPGDELRQRVTELITQGDPPGRWPGLR